MGEAMPHVYVKSADLAWVPGRVTKSDGKTSTVVISNKMDEAKLLASAPQTSGTTVKEVKVNLKDYPNNVLPMQNVDDRGKLLDKADMVNLPYLHEPAILYNIKTRHMKAKPYTRTGDMVVAVNPYQWVDGLYSDDKKKQYSQKLVWEMSEADARDGLEPHVYETAALSYKGMAFEGGMNQSILVSGESGAGKTETVKICLNHIATVQQGPGGSHQESPVLKRILESNPLLEAFGNAKTRRNDNSSRFGKYLQLQFDHAGERGRPVCKLIGSKAEVFLLEKNRVTYHDTAERTYHIFYQLVAAPEAEKAKIWSGLKGTTNESFRYVGKTDTNEIEGMTDAQHYQATVDTLRLTGIDEGDITKLMQAISTVLQLGNITFCPKDGDTDKAAIQEGLEGLSTLMGLPEADLALALTERTIVTREGSIKTPLSPDLARQSADALAGEVYQKVFKWTVRAINKETSAENREGAPPKFGLIGLLDIFGFESFPENRFEQLCINYANEKLQQKFTEDIFKAVVEEYKYEGIPLDQIQYDDNTAVLSLIEGRTGLCALLNEECIRPNGSGDSFVNKALGANKNSPCLEPNKTDRSGFAVIHYAGTVLYSASGFVEANKDTLPQDLEDAAEKCGNSIISSGFTIDKYAAGATGPGGKKKPKRQKSNLMAPTVWTKYKTQLSMLMTNLYATHSRYIRCIKPNTQKKKLVMEHGTTVGQLRCAGIVAGVTISRSAFPNKLSNSVVYARYNAMWDRDKFPSAGGGTVLEKARANCQAVLNCALKEKEEKGKDGKVVKAFQVGKTRTYFRAGALELLESQRVTGLDAHAIAIQKYIRGWLLRQSLGIVPGKRAAEEEARRRAEEERLARLAAEKKAMDAKAKEAVSAAKKEEKALLKQIEEEDERTKRTLAELEAKFCDLDNEKIDLARRLKEISEGVNATKTEEARLQGKLDANMNQVKNLKKENAKLKKSLDKIEEKHKSLNANNKKMRGTLDVDNDAQKEVEYAKTVEDRLVEDRETAINDHVQLKEGVANKQTEYMAYAESRLDIQRTLAKILNLIQANCTDNQLMQDTQNLALATQEDAKRIMDELQAKHGD